MNERAGAPSAPENRTEPQTCATSSKPAQALLSVGHSVADIPVRINLDIIKLFSEGLYQSPHKAVEELVTNGYDADAHAVHVLLPEGPHSRLWVIDDGHGMDDREFHQLWRVADSKKGARTKHNRQPIGQFGIGKLAAYVLARELTHLSYSHGRYLCTTMDFRRVAGRQSEPSEPVVVALRELREAEAQSALHAIRERDPSAWRLLFGNMASDHWTVAALGDFKDLYKKLHARRLEWVLSTGLPLHSNFSVYVDGVLLKSSKEQIALISEHPFSKNIPNIGKVTGTARIYEKPLTSGKSLDVGRSNGYFVCVRGRVINLDDALFGTPQPNLAAWSCFALRVDADGLRDLLLSSREGVRDTESVREFRNYLVEQFNHCRRAFDEWHRRDLETLDLAALLDDDVNSPLTAPLVSHVREVLRTRTESFYIDTLTAEDTDGVLEQYDAAVRNRPVDDIKFQKDGPHAATIRYDPSTRRLVVNSEHPFIDKMAGARRNRVAAELFATAELTLEAQLRERQMDGREVAALLADRDRGLRIMAGERPTTATEVIRRLSAARGHSLGLERAVGEVFRALGFLYERRGGTRPGPDGLLWARLGRVGATVADYRLVYDTKTTAQPSVPADRVDLAALEEIRVGENATFGFFVARKYAAECDPESALNRRVKTEVGDRLTLLTTTHLQRLVLLHFRHGVTLLELRGLFESCRTPMEATGWLDELETRRDNELEIPLGELLAAIEREREDDKAVPNVIAVRATRPEWRRFEPSRLIARLKAVELLAGQEWIQVKESGEVLMRQSVGEVLARVERELGCLSPETPVESV